MARWPRTLTIVLPLVVLLTTISGCSISGTDRLKRGAEEAVLASPLVPAHDEGATAGPYAPSRRLAPPAVAPATPTRAAVQAPQPQPGRVNILVMGVDERETWSEGPPRTDAMMLVSIDASSRLATVLSIPRDLWVSIPGYGQERVNVAYRVAELTEPGSGPQKACETISALLGVPVTKYAVVNFRAVTQIIDAMGGVEVDVPYEIWDHMYPTEDNRYMTVHFPAGPQTLTGEKALQYARTRYGSTDFERMRRQQQVIEALQRRVLRPEFLPQLPGLLRLARDCIKTNVSVSEMLALWNAFGDARHQPVRFAVVDETLTYPWITSLGAEVLLPNMSGIDALVAELGLGEDATAALAQGLQIRIFASSESDRSFASAVTALGDAGFVVIEGGVHRHPITAALVLDYSGGEHGREVAAALGLASSQVLTVPRPANVPVAITADILLWSGAAGD